MPGIFLLLTMALTILAIRNVDASSPVANSTQSFNGTNLEANSTQEFGDWRRNATPLAFVTEGWSEGFMLGSLIIMACITIANMRKGVFLHKLVLLEVCREMDCSLLTSADTLKSAFVSNAAWNVLFHEL